MRFAVLLFLLLAGNANAETFNCQAGTFWDAKAKIVVIATIDDGGELGTIKVAGITHKARYHVEGFDRRWDFGLQDDGTFNYAFVLKPNGVAIYYDFSGADAGEKVSGSQTFNCR
ncbi:MAG: hypothetical protein R3F21_22045 [Myxococcota bacterium]